MDRMEALGREAFKEIAPGDLRTCLFWLAWRSVETRPRNENACFGACSSHWPMEAYPIPANAVPDCYLS
jgi:hypothetical protein